MWFKQRINYIEEANKELSQQSFLNSESVKPLRRKLFTVLNCSNRIANHLIHNGLESAFRESFDSERDFIVHFMNHFIRTGNKTNSAEAGMHRPEEVKSPPPPLQMHILCVCVVYIQYIYNTYIVALVLFWLHLSRWRHSGIFCFECAPDLPKCVYFCANHSWSFLWIFVNNLSK